MAVTGLRKAIFLDKDGTLVNDVPWNVDPALVSFTSGAFHGLRLLQKQGYVLFVITNQSGIARGMFDLAALQNLENHLHRLLALKGVRLDGFYFCPHDMEGSIEAYSCQCTCRKPQPGLLLQAAREHCLDLSRSWMIGDILHDIEAGRSAGCHTVLIDNGNETEWQLTPQRTPHLKMPDLHQAARAISAFETCEAVLTTKPSHSDGYLTSAGVS